jgi:hypothetical protein
MPIKKKKKMQMVHVLVKYTRNSIDFSLFNDIFDAENAKWKMEREGFQCRLIRKLIM